MPNQVDYKPLTAAIMRMCEGDIGSFIEARRLMDDMNFVSLSGQIEEKKLSAFFVGRCFLEQVITNLAADSMFEFPPEGTRLEKVFRELSSSTGTFLQEMLLSKRANYSIAIKHLTHAINLYYRYLRTLNQVGRRSDLGNHDHIWQSQGVRMKSQ